MKASPPPALLYHRTCADQDVLGIAAVPGRLPQLLRWPGEPLASLLSRARLHATGCGKLRVIALTRVP